MLEARKRPPIIISIDSCVHISPPTHNLSGDTRKGDIASLESITMFENVM